MDLVFHLAEGVEIFSRESDTQYGSTGCQCHRECGGRGLFSSSRTNVTFGLSCGEMGMLQMGFWRVGILRKGESLASMALGAYGCGSVPPKKHLWLSLSDKACPTAQSATLSLDPEFLKCGLSSPIDTLKIIGPQRGVRVRVHMLVRDLPSSIASTKAHVPKQVTEFRDTGFATPGLSRNPESLISSS